MGVVYRAQDPAIGRTIAIKTIRLSDLTDPNERDRMRDRLFREAQSAGILSHPNIVTIYDIHEESGLAYIFMEFVNGPTLEQVLGNEQPPTRDSLFETFRQTAAALDYAHKKGIVHRDIKPANIMIHEDGAAKITDFGVAKIASSQMTQSGTMMGTPSYMSPEQVQGGSVDGRSDQFALAVIAYEVLTGEKPFVAEYLPSLLYKICREEPSPAQRLNPTLAPEVDGVLRKALAKSAADRHATCSDFIRELRAACNLRPDWVALPRGSSQDLPTLASNSAVPVPDLSPISAAPSTPLARLSSLDPKTVPPSPAQPVPASADVPSPAASAAVPRPLSTEKREGHTVRNTLIAVAAVIVLALVVFVSQRPLSPTDTPAAPPVEAGSQPKPSALEPNPSSPPQAPPAAPVETPVAEAPKTTAPAKPVTPTDTAPRRTPPDSGVEDVHVQILTAPGGAQVIVDGVPRCTSPCDLNLSRGRHVMLARLEGHRESRRIFQVPDESSLTIDLERITGTLSVASTPAGATIVINGQPRAEKTPAILKLPVGTYRLQVTKDQLKTDEETIVITDGGMSQRRYQLE